MGLLAGGALSGLLAMTPLEACGGMEKGAQPHAALPHQLFQRGCVNMPRGLLPFQGANSKVSIASPELAGPALMMWGATHKKQQALGLESP